jgi:SAM-dependent methyltransferase
MHLEGAGLDCDVVQGDAESLPFEDASFDLASSNGVLHHTPNIEGALRELHRVLRPGGQARIVLYHRDSLHYWGNQVFLDGILRRRLLREGSMSAILSANVERSSVGARPLVRVYSRRQMRMLLQGVGFEGVTLAIRHLQEGDTFVLDMLGARMQWLLEPRVLDRLGRWAGWYVIGTGSKPA